MQQIGSATIITPSIRLILLDCYETLVELADNHYRPRRGIPRFIEHYAVKMGMPLVVVSDAHKDDVVAALAQAQLGQHFRAIYHKDNASENLGEGRTRKRLDVVVADFSVKPRDAMFIGDSPMDALAAQHHGLCFIRVPRSEDRDFDFSRLITGASRYNSQDFSATFVERYGKPKQADDRP
jgi:phosphoglycolate phosphatase-like HAD superfamily hydrolase